MDTVQTSAVSKNPKAVDLLFQHLRAQESMPRDLASPSPAPATGKTAGQALTFLDAFGYLSQELSQWKDITLDDILKAVADFQALFGLKQTGTLTAQTVRAMQFPRCGCPDIPRAWHKNYHDVQARVRALLPAWKKRGLTYYIQQVPPGLDTSAFAATIQNSFELWSRLGNIVVTPTHAAGATPDIVISAGRGAQFNFDGPSGTLAWAYLPDGNDGQLMCRLDLDEAWILPGQAGPGIKVAHVTAHEFGHLYGLDHSKIQTALMAPYYSETIGTPQTNDDIPRFQARYGTTPASPPVVPPVSPPTSPPTDRNRVTVVTAGDIDVYVNGKKA